MTIEKTTIANQPNGALWYVVNPGGLAAYQGDHCYAGPDRATAVDRVVAMLARGEIVRAGDRFRPDPADAYVSVTQVERCGHHETARLGVPSLDEEKAIIAEAQTVLDDSRATEQDEIESTEAHECDECHVQPDGTHQDGTRCPCSVREPINGCRCQASQAAWMGPAYVRAEIAAEEC
jgi:hypothetical protein